MATKQTNPPKTETPEKKPSGQKPQTELEGFQQDLQQDADKRLEQRGTRAELSWLKDAVENKPLDRFREEAKNLNEEYIKNIEERLSSSAEEEKYDAFGDLCGIIAINIVLPLNRSGALTTEDLQKQFPKDILQKILNEQELSTEKRKLVELLLSTFKEDDSFGLDLSTQKLIWDKFIERTLQAVPYVDGAKIAIENGEAKTEAEKAQQSFYKRHPGVTIFAVVAGAYGLYKVAKWIFGKGEDSSPDGEKKMSWWKKVGLCLLGFFGLGQILGLDAVKKVLQGTWFDVDNNRLLKSIALVSRGKFKEAALLLGPGAYGALAKVFGWPTYDELKEKYNELKEKAGEIIDDAKETLEKLEEELHLSEAKEKLLNFVEKFFPNASEQAKEWVTHLSPANILNWAKEKGFTGGDIITWLKDKGGIETLGIAGAYILLGKIIGTSARNKLALPTIIYMLAINSGDDSLVNKITGEIAKFMDNIKEDVANYFAPYDIPGVKLSETLKSFSFEEMSKGLLEYMKDNPGTSAAIGTGVWIAKGYIWSFAKFLARASLKTILTTAGIAWDHKITTGVLALVGYVNRREIVEKLMDIVDKIAGGNFDDREKYEQELKKILGVENPATTKEEIQQNIVNPFTLDPAKDTLSNAKKIYDNIRSGENVVSFDENGWLVLRSAANFNPICAIARFTAKEEEDFMLALSEFDLSGAAVHGIGVVVGAKSAFEAGKATWAILTLKSGLGSSRLGALGHTFGTCIPFSKSNLYVLRSSVGWTGVDKLSTWWFFGKNLSNVTSKLETLLNAKKIDITAIENELSALRTFINDETPKFTNPARRFLDPRKILRNSREWSIAKRQLSDVERKYEVINNTWSKYKASGNIEDLTQMRIESKEIQEIVRRGDRALKSASEVAGSTDDAARVAGSTDDVAKSATSTGKPTSGEQLEFNFSNTAKGAEVLSHGAKEVTVSADKLWQIFHCKDPQKIATLLEKTIGRDRFYINGVDKFDDAVKAIRAGELTETTGLVNYVDDVAIKVGGVSFAFKALVCVQVLGVAVEAWVAYKKVKEILDEDNAEMRKVLISGLPPTLLSLGLSSYGAYAGVAGWIAASSAAGSTLGTAAATESIAAAGAGASVGTIMLPAAMLVAIGAETVDSVNKSRIEDVMKPEDWIQKAGGNPKLLYQFWTETIDDINYNDSLRAFWTTATTESITKNKAQIREVIAKALIETVFSDNNSWTAPEREAAFLILQKDVGRNGWGVAHTNDAMNQIEKAGNILTIIRGLKDGDPDYTQNPIFGRVLNIINLEPKDIINKLSSHDLSMINRAYSEKISGNTKENREQMEKELIMESESMEEYVLFKYAKFMGYTDNQAIGTSRESGLLERLKNKFFTEDASGINGLYFKNNTWVVTEAGWEIDDKMEEKKQNGEKVPLQGRPLLEAIAKRLEENADNIFETRHDKLLDFVSSSYTMRNQALKLAQLMRSSIALYEKYKSPEASPETSAKAA